jgi:hypothetical protein
MTDAQRNNAQRAIQTYAAMQRWLYLPHNGSLYREIASTAAPNAFLWPFSRALQGTLTLAGIGSAAGLERTLTRDVEDRLVGLERYWDGRARVPGYDSSVRPWFGRGGDKYYDDNVWVALALVQAYRLKLSPSLDRARQLFAFGLSGRDTRTSAPASGGLFWVQQGVGVGIDNHDRGAGTSAGNALLGFHLHALTPSESSDGNQPPPLNNATDLLDWVATYLDSSHRGWGPYWNVVREDGSIDTNLWTYNQGIVVGARVLQYRVTGDPAHLDQAETVARQTLATFGDFTRQPPSFNAMCFQNLLMLHSVTSDNALQVSITRTLERYADWTWAAETGARDPVTDLFRFADSGRPARGQGFAKLQDQGAMVQLYALLAWDPSDYAELC